MFRREGCIYRRIARRIQYALLLVVDKPGFERSSEGVCYLITLVWYGILYVTGIMYCCAILLLEVHVSHCMSFNDFLGLLQYAVMGPP